MTRLDVVRLTGLRGRGRHGVLAAEKELGQEFVLDLALHLDTRAAGASDDLADAVSYADVATAAHAVLVGEPVDLLEALAARIAATVLADVRVRAVDVVVHKPAAPITVPFDDVSVEVHRTNPRSRAVIALGANTGDRAASLRSAVAALAAVDGLEVTGVSGVHETDPWGPVAQPDYLNAVLTAVTDLAPLDLLRACRAVEDAHGRDRGGEERWGPRPLDVDLVAVEDLDVDLVGADGLELRLPHPRAHDRAFVLVPWAELAPRAPLPGTGPGAGTAVGVLAARAAAADPGAVRPRPDLVLGGVVGQVGQVGVVGVVAEGRR